MESLLSRGTVGDIQIALEPYETDTKTMSILDRGLISEGLLPVLVVLLNNGDTVYGLNPHEIFLVDKDGSLSAAATATTMGKATGKSELSPQSRDAAEAAGLLGLRHPLSLPLLPLVLPFVIADQSAQAHNQRLAREYLAIGLPYYIPQGETRGFIFFQIPKGETVLLDGYRVKFGKIGPRGSAEYLQVEIPIVGVSGKEK